MRFETYRKLKRKHKLQLFELWNSEFPLSLGHKQPEDFENYLHHLENSTHYLLSLNDRIIVGWIYSFERFEETWFGLLINSPFQRKGHGSRLLNILKGKNSLLNGWVIDHNADLKSNGEIYASPMAFYLKNQFITVPENRLEKDQLSAVQIRWEK